MGNVNIKKDAYILTQTGKEIQTILDNVKALNSSDVKELCKLLAEIKDYESGDDSQSIGQQLINALDHMVREDEVQTEVNDSAYPPQSKAVKDVIETHKNAPELDHADGSIKGRHIADNAIVTSQLRDNIITASKLRPNIISENHLSNTLQAKINNAIDEEGLLKYASIISTAPKYKLSDLHRDADIGYDIPGNMDEYFILKNDTSETYDMEILWNEVYSWELTKPIRNGKTYLCILRDLVDTGDDVFHDGKIEVVTEMGSDIIDLQTDMQKLIQNTKGTWHYGDTLTHTENSKPVTLDVGAKAGDFYLNIQHFYVYYTQNGTDWTYIGNLTGSVDTSKWAPINSPIFTGTPMADTPSATNNSRQLATTEFVRNAIESYISIQNGVWDKFGKHISGDGDFNNITQTGLYIVSDTAKNAPIDFGEYPVIIEDDGYGLIVFDKYDAVANYKMQIAFQNGDIWTRYASGMSIDGSYAWVKWSKLPSATEIASLEARISALEAKENATNTSENT